MRYIHQNPLKAGMVKEIQAYPWSSYHEYIKTQTSAIPNLPSVYSLLMHSRLLSYGKNLIRKKMMIAAWNMMTGSD